MGVNFPHDEEAIEELKLLSSRAKRISNTTATAPALSSSPS